LLAFPDTTQQPQCGGYWDAVINDGLHYHGIIAIPTESRLRVGLKFHFQDKKKKKVVHSPWVPVEKDPRGTCSRGSYGEKGLWVRFQIAGMENSRYGPDIYSTQIGERVAGREKATGSRIRGRGSRTPSLKVTFLPPKSRNAPTVARC